MEKLGLSPKELFKVNKGLIFARLSGYGQTGLYFVFFGRAISCCLKTCYNVGPNRLDAGHDINYIAGSGMLESMGRSGERPIFASNLVGDFAGGSMMCATGILLAYIHRLKTGEGQIVGNQLYYCCLLLLFLIFLTTLRCCNERRSSISWIIHLQCNPPEYHVFVNIYLNLLTIE
jgi:crotonobetainyl-CoA:carnitine CoA-transferase CaiB-like acyl-CoA transferase